MSKKKKKIEIAVDELEKSNDKLINKLAEMHYIMYDLKESVNVMSIALKHTAKVFFYQDNFLSLIIENS